MRPRNKQPQAKKHQQKRQRPLSTSLPPAQPTRRSSRIVAERERRPAKSKSVYDESGDWEEMWAETSDEDGDHREEDDEDAFLDPDDDDDEYDDYDEYDEYGQKKGRGRPRKYAAGERAPRLKRPYKRAAPKASSSREPGSKRPRGRPPKGMAWNAEIGDWVDMTAEEVAIAEAEKPERDPWKRPPGRTPVGMVWSGLNGGCWVPE